MKIAEPLSLPGGLTLPNRLCKAAMTENLADGFNRTQPKHETLYRRWASGGIGLQITGNVLIDRRYLEAPGNIAIEPGEPMEALQSLRLMADAAKSGGGAVFMQLSHAGRQTPKIVSERPVAPSAVALDLAGRSLHPFAAPREMLPEEIADTIKRFGNAARIARETGYDGVQVHAAHGYLISQFLSPLTNRRNDAWGGDFDRRVRFLVEVLKQVKLDAGADYPVAVKLNSADFQKGGFTHEDCIAVVDRLNELDVAFLEISGGTYEQPQMIGVSGNGEPESDGRLRASTVAREAYFVEYAKSVRARARMPIMATGGFRSAAGMNAAIEAGYCDLIGLARPLCVDPDAPQKLLAGALETLPAPEQSLRLGPGMLSPTSGSRFIRTINGWGAQGYFAEQVRRLGQGQEPKLGLGVIGGLTAMRSAMQGSAKRRRKALAGSTGSN